jgi:hypothetical protein
MRTEIQSWTSTHLFYYDQVNFLTHYKQLTIKKRKPTRFLGFTITIILLIEPEKHRL